MPERMTDAELNDIVAELNFAERIHRANTGAPGKYGEAARAITELREASAPADPQREREALKAALTEGYWQRTGYRASWQAIGPLMDAILAAGFRLVGTKETNA